MQTFRTGERVEIRVAGDWYAAEYTGESSGGHHVIREGVLWFALDCDIRRRAQAPAHAPAHTDTRTSAERKAQPIATGVLAYFPRTLAALSEVSRRGNDKHNPGEPLHWAHAKSTDEADCCVRHIVDALQADGQGVPGGVLAPNEDGSPHLIAALWRLAAWCERALEGDERWRTVAKP